jgi:prohibitin 1
MKSNQLLSLLLIGLIGLSSCVTVRQTEVGVRRTAGKLSDRTVDNGLYFVSPWSTMLKVPISTENLSITADLPTQEGLTVFSEMSILYRVERNKIVDLLKTVGPDYERVVILPVFRSVVRDVSARFMAKDLHTAERSKIEKTIKDDMDKYLKEKGFVVEAVLLKSIKLPQELTSAIEQKLRAEQESIRMTFVLDREKQEAERKKIEAGGIRDAQKIISEGLNPLLINWRSIEAFKELSKSNNTKVIITDGRTPMIVQPSDIK